MLELIRELLYIEEVVEAVKIRSQLNVVYTTLMSCITS